ncbi:ribonuclease HII [Rothia sp. LK2588]|uniref:ribonuclease HII n=1 Tax=Rothia sp. LK2588 TaxID=3114369 RepID=UPI0034CF8E51
MVSSQTQATLETEETFFASGVDLIAGMDEVGRGSLAGPVSVGVALVPAGTVLSVEGLTDSKALSKLRRESMVSDIETWCTTAVGSATPQEIDEWGMTAALRVAGHRALAQAVSTAGQAPDMVLLDGKHDWFTSPADDLLSMVDPTQLAFNTALNRVWGNGVVWSGPVHTVIKGDLSCASISAASVVAKVHRDELMTRLAQEYPAYGWEKNMGYGSAAHREAVETHGPTVHHRLSWNLGVSEDAIRDCVHKRENLTSL